MTKDEIQQVFDKLLAMYPTTKLTSNPQKVVETWRTSAALLDFPWARRGDLYRRVQDHCGYFPNLSELAAMCRAISPRTPTETCPECDGDRYVPVFVDDEPQTMTYTNKHGQVHTYAGAPIRYTFVVQCPTCNPDTPSGGTTLASGGAEPTGTW